MSRVSPAGLAPYLDRLRELPFVRTLAVATPPGADRAQTGTTAKVRTGRRAFTFAVDVKQTFLDRTLTNGVIARHRALLRSQGLPLLLLARYIPRPTGERLANAGVNFVDRAGNMHLRLGDDHHILLLGRREPALETTDRRPGPALVQLQFVLLADPASAAWPVRRLAADAGIGKTAAAAGLQRLSRQGVLEPDRARGYRLANRERLADEFVRGYTDVLRPHLAMGRFRGPEQDPQRFLRRLRETARTLGATWAATGTPAAYALDRFYRGTEVPVFIEGFTHALQQALRLVPDRQHGPITVLHPFGQHWIWRTVAGVRVVHPWLVYAELLHRDEPRALEAAEQLRQRFLAP